MTSVTVLGLGPMGQALAGALLDANHRATVWNRTESKADAVRARGAVWAPTPADAVAAGDLTIINLVDHDVVDNVVSAAGDAITGRVIVGLSSDTPDRARQTAKLVENLGGRYLDGAIMTPTDTIGSDSASILFAGPLDVFDARREVFAALGEVDLARRGLRPCRRLRHVAARPVLDVGQRISACADGGPRQRHRAE